MLTSWSFLLCASIASAFPPPKNLDFQQQTANWSGQGFERVAVTRPDAKVEFHVTSEKHAGRTEPAVLYQTFDLPKNAGTLHARAHSVTKNGRADRKLDVYVESAGRSVVPKFVRSGHELREVRAIDASRNGEMHEYVWPVAALAGQTVRIVIVDMDRQKGNYVVSGGFRLRPKDDYRGELFRAELKQLVDRNRLVDVEPYSSEHFYALSNAEEDYARAQLKRCEMMYAMFLRHFHKKGFRLHAPPERMQVAVFRSQKGYEAYLGAPVGTFITGVFQTKRNRLVVYNFGRNRDLDAHRKKMEDRIVKASTELERRLLSAALSQQLDDIRSVTNVSTLMHETAHQMCYNTGMLNRNGDAPLWLVEGLACYCEASRRGHWTGIGEISDVRVKTLKQALAGKRPLVPLKELLRDDLWFRGPNGVRYALTGYAQSWALVRMLMEERSQSMRRYLDLIKDRRTDDHRLTDFAQIFGADLDELERRHLKYVKRLTE